MENYVQLIERIAHNAGLLTEEIERKIEAKRAKLSGLVSKEGAAQIVAAELGIHFDKERMKIGELVTGMKRVHILGKAVNIGEVRSFVKNEKEGKVASLVIADETGNMRLVLWDTHHIALLEQGIIKQGEVIEVSNAAVRNGELHLSSFGELKQSAEKLGEVKAEQVYHLKKLSEVKAGDKFKTRAFMIQLFEPRYFDVCPECGRKVLDEDCKVHGKIIPQRRALLNIILDDGSETIRCVLFGEHIYQLGFDEETVFSIEKFLEQRGMLLGEERFFSGSIRENALYHNLEFSIEKVEPVAVDLLLQEFEAQA